MSPSRMRSQFSGSELIRFSVTQGRGSKPFSSQFIFVAIAATAKPQQQCVSYTKYFSNENYDLEKIFIN